MIRVTKHFIKFLFPLFLLGCKNNTTSTKKSPVTQNNNINVHRDSMSNPDASVDISPMDMSYYPIDYPKLKMTNSITGPPVVRLIYSRPHLQGRKLFQNLLKYGEPWRLGANEATEIQFYKEVTIQGKKIPAGRYILYCIPEKDNWTIVLNSNIDTWGLRMDSTKDIQRFNIPISTNNPPLEYLTMVFEKTNTGADLLMAWDNIVARLPINF